MIKKTLLILLIVLLGFIFAKPSYAISVFSGFFDNKTISNITMSTGWWVSPTVKVTSPDGGEMWLADSTHDITWTAVSSDPAGTITKVDILLSTDGGATYPTTLVSGIANSGSYSWTIGDPKSTNMRVKVSATDNHDLVGSDESDNVFDPSSNPDPNATTINTVVADTSASLNSTAQDSTESAQLESASSSADLGSSADVTPTPTPTVTPTPTPPDQTTSTDNPNTTAQGSDSNTTEASQ